MAAKRAAATTRLPAVSAQVKKTIAKLEAFAKARKSIKLRTRKLSDAAKKRIAADASLPASYRAFLVEYGYVWIEHYGDPMSKMIPPEPVSAADPGEDLPESSDLDAAIAFQTIGDESSPNFFCFNPNVDLGKGELEVVQYYGEDAHEFALPKKKSKDSVRFDEHVVACFAELMDDYAGED